LTYVCGRRRPSVQPAHAVVQGAAQPAREDGWMCEGRLAARARSDSNRYTVSGQAGRGGAWRWLSVGGRGEGGGGCAGVGGGEGGGSAGATGRCLGVLTYGGGGGGERRGRGAWWLVGGNCTLLPGLGLGGHTGSGGGWGRGWGGRGGAGSSPGAGAARGGGWTSHPRNRAGGARAVWGHGGPLESRWGEGWGHGCWEGGEELRYRGVGSEPIVRGGRPLPNKTEGGGGDLVAGRGGSILGCSDLLSTTLDRRPYPG